MNYTVTVITSACEHDLNILALNYRLDCAEIHQLNMCPIYWTARYKCT